MGRTFVSGNGLGVAKGFYFLFEGFDAPLEPGHILLLSEKLRIEFFDGFVLHRRQTFEFDDPFLHGDHYSTSSNVIREVYGL